MLVEADVSVRTKAVNLQHTQDKDTFSPFHLIPAQPCFVLPPHNSYVIPRSLYFVYLTIAVADRSPSDLSAMLGTVHLGFASEDITGIGLFLWLCVAGLPMSHREKSACWKMS